MLERHQSRPQVRVRGPKGGSAGRHEDGGGEASIETLGGSQNSVRGMRRGAAGRDHAAGFVVADRDGEARHHGRARISFNARTGLSLGPELIVAVGRRRLLRGPPLRTQSQQKMPCYSSCLETMLWENGGERIAHGKGRGKADDLDRLEFGGGGGVGPPFTNDDLRLGEFAGAGRICGRRSSRCSRRPQVPATWAFGRQACSKRSSAAGRPGARRLVAGSRQNIVRAPGQEPRSPQTPEIGQAPGGGGTSIRTRAKGRRRRRAADLEFARGWDTPRAHGPSRSVSTSFVFPAGGLLRKPRRGGWPASGAQGLSNYSQDVGWGEDARGLGPPRPAGRQFLAEQKRLPIPPRPGASTRRGRPDPQRFPKSMLMITTATGCGRLRPAGR